MGGADAWGVTVTRDLDGQKWMDEECQECLRGVLKFRQVRFRELRTIATLVLLSELSLSLVPTAANRIVVSLSQSHWHQLAWHHPRANPVSLKIGHRLSIAALAGQLLLLA